MYQLLTMNKKDKKKEEERISNIQMQWVFVIAGAFLAVTGGLMVNSLYDLMLKTTPAWKIFAFSAPLFFWFLDMGTYLFENVEEIRDDPDGSARHLAAKYCKYRWGTIKALFIKK